MRVVPTALGDGVLFYRRERLTKVAGVFGLIPVRHGVPEVRARECDLKDAKALLEELN